MELSVKTLAGKAAGKTTVDDAIFGIEDIRGDLLQRTVRWQLAKRQAGTHKTQVRGEVSVTTKKYIRQKGSGGARHGSKNAGIFKGGAVAHGPRVRSHAHDLPKKIRKLALAHALSSKVKSGSLIVLDEATAKTPKTKDLSAQFAAMGLTKALIIGGVSLDENFAKAASNIPNIDVLPVAGLNVYDVLRRDMLVVTKDALEGIQARFDGTHVASPFGGDNFVDDIQLIDGVGPKSAKELRKAGLASLTAIAEAKAADLAKTLEGLGLAERAVREDWVAQAKEMIGGSAPRAKVDRDYAARILAKRAKEGK
jgi:large subunit ribosomal protein L4